jgi:DNA helicase II / ATP-dependent DNA helicase PcrA
MQSHLLHGLNEAQYTAATIKNGPAVVFAGAGSGKTRIITTRIAWLIEQGVRPWEILAVTFTNKAAREMRERLLHMCPETNRTLVSTFHSACAKWLREFAAELGFTSDFSIYDDADTTSLIKKIMKSATFPIERDATPSEFKYAIGEAKTRGLFPHDAPLHKKEFDKFMPVAGVAVYKGYQEALALANAMDFNDLIMNVILLLRTNQRVRDALQGRFQFILVDEYQDTNRPQNELIETLAAKHENIFIVGDDDQSIYSWRGAVPSNILDFQKVHPTAKICKLEQNYRCSGTIVQAASELIQNNKVRADKTLRTDNTRGDLIEFRYETDAEFEAWWVAKRITDELQRFPVDQIAIFYRTNSQSRALEDALRKERIAYQIFGNVKFYDRVEVKDILAYLKILVNPRDDVSFLRILNTPNRGLGDSVEALLIKQGEDHKICLYDAAKSIATQDIPRVSKKIFDFVKMLSTIESLFKTSPLAALVEVICEEINYFPYLQKKYPDQYEDKQENVMELQTAISQFGIENPGASLSDWIQALTLDSEAEGTPGGVSLMTLHMSKGLEFNRVYITGVEESLLPHFNSLDDKQSLEEERRLMYVGMTRAKQKLSLTAAYMRQTWGRTQSNDVSRFLTEIPERCLKNLTPPQNKAKFAAMDRYDADDENGTNSSENVQVHYDYTDESDDQLLEVGSSVHHPTYGSGTVEDIQSTYGRPKVVVRFADFGLRRVDPRHLDLNT